MVIYRAKYGTHCSTSRYGQDSWAIVTGGTGGLGKSAVLCLSQLGFNIIMISNDYQKMTIVENEVIHKFPKIKVEKYQLDCARNYQPKDFE